MERNELEIADFSD
jgi:hypothetical protein